MEKKVIKLTESDLKKIINKIVNERITEDTMVGNISNFVFDKLISLVRKIGTTIDKRTRKNLEDELGGEMKKSNLDFEDLFKIKKEKEEEEEREEVKVKERPKTKYKGNKNILIGDSHVPYIDRFTESVSKLSNRSGKESLWSPDRDATWLTSALREFEVTPEVKNVFISLGTTSGFGKYGREDIKSLFGELEDKFPNANYYVIQGSWGGSKKVTENDVERYYEKFEKFGGRVIDPPIGNVRVGEDYSIYKKVGSKIDRIV